jgi:hypothetical protein
MRLKMIGRCRSFNSCALHATFVPPSTIFAMMCKALPAGKAGAG